MRDEMRGAGHGGQAGQDIRPQSDRALSPFKISFRRSFVSGDKLKQRVEVVGVRGIKISKDIRKSAMARQRCDAGALALAHALHAAKRQVGGRSVAQSHQYALSEARPAARAALSLAAVTTCRTDRQDWCVAKHAKSALICTGATLHYVTASVT
ncbi:MAG: hypothetical protein AAF360_00680 [Pseudomonadota bacterium]